MEAVLQVRDDKFNNFIDFKANLDLLGVQNNPNSFVFYPVSKFSLLHGKTLDHVYAYVFGAWILFIVTDRVNSNI